MVATSMGILTGIPLMLVGMPILISLPFGMPIAIRYIRMVTGL